MKLTRRHFLHTAGGATLLASMGCDQIPDGLLPIPPQSSRANGPFQAPSCEQIDLISHSLNRLTFGARPGDYQRVKALGKTEPEAFTAFLEEQLHPDKIADKVCDFAIRRFETLSLPIGELYEYQEKLLLAELTRATTMRAVMSERQLFEVMVQFWSDHFNIDPSKGDCKWLKMADDREVIRVHALGKFPEMLHASALSPAMLWYLDGRVNRKSQADDKPNENYARELLELHTLGVHGGYTQRDVMEVARCLTGWTVRNRKPYFGIGSVDFKLNQHDQGEKQFLGQTIPAIPQTLSRDAREEMARNELVRVMEIVSLHPATAKYIAEKLCRRFIADEPPAAAIKQVADTFLRTSGDIKDTLRTLFATDEFQQSRGNKFKRPFNYIVSAIRATDATTEAEPPLMDYFHRMGHAPFHYPTPDGYPEEATPWMSTLLWRWNFAVTFAEGRMEHTRTNLEKLTNNLGGPVNLMAHLLGRRPTAEEQESYHRSGAGLALLLAAPAFQRC